MHEKPIRPNRVFIGSKKRETDPSPFFILRARLTLLYKKMLRSFGPQKWWPARTRFEVVAGAILTQNTAWRNVEQALLNLRKNGLLNPERMRTCSPEKLAGHIRSSGYYNSKAVKLHHFLNYFFTRYRGSFAKMKQQPLEPLRMELLNVFGIGPETADSILLYALDKPVFVADTYTRRILSRHGFCREDASYAELQKTFMDALRPNAGMFNEYHALLVQAGKNFCTAKNPRCEACPLRTDLPQFRKRRDNSAKT